MARIDLHQHLWPEPLLALLARRSAPPRLRRRGHGWELVLAGEAPSSLELAAHDPVVRALEAERDGFDRIAIAPSAPLGIESLPEEDAVPLLGAFHAGILELGAPYLLWGALGGHDLTGPAVDALLDAGAVGACLPAGLLAGEAELAAAAPALERLGARGAPLLVHPGPVAAAHAGAPAWWPALTAYVAEMNAAWHAFAALGRPAHPRLRVLYAMLAGGAPLHAERLEARGGPVGAVHDELTFFDVSSYGPRTVDAMLRVVGADRLVYGSDRPVVEPRALGALGRSVMHALAAANPARLLAPVPVAA
jgi:hypothetical protein